MFSITLKGLAKFMTASPANQRKILRDYKYPKEEGQAMAQYYKEARDVVYSFHKNKRSKEWLMTKAIEIRTLAAGVGGGSGPRLQNNARAIEQYAQNFSSRKIDILPDLHLSFTTDGVRVKINPDLHISEGGKEKIVKLEFAKDAAGFRKRTEGEIWIGAVAGAGCPQVNLPASLPTGHPQVR